MFICKGYNNLGLNGHTLNFSLLKNLLLGLLERWAQLKLEWEFHYFSVK